MLHKVVSFIISSQNKPLSSQPPSLPNLSASLSVILSLLFLCLSLDTSPPSLSLSLSLFTALLVLVFFVWPSFLSVFLSAFIFSLFATTSKYIVVSCIISDCCCFMPLPFLPPLPTSIPMHILERQKMHPNPTASKSACSMPVFFNDMNVFGRAWSSLLSWCCVADRLHPSIHPLTDPGMFCQRCNVWSEHHFSGIACHQSGPTFWQPHYQAANHTCTIMQCCLRLIKCEDSVRLVHLIPSRVFPSSTESCHTTLHRALSYYTRHSTHTCIHAYDHIMSMAYTCNAENAQQLGTWHSLHVIATWPHSQAARQPTSAAGGDRNTENKTRLIHSRRAW